MAAETLDGPAHIFVDGAVLRTDDPALDAEILRSGRCYTTTRVHGGEPTWPTRHEARLARDARHHDIPPPEPGVVVDAMRALARAEFSTGEGVVRLQLGLDAAGGVHLVGIPRPIGSEPDAWTLGIAPTVHPGPGARAGAKMLGLPFIETARLWLAASAFDEAVLFDASGHLVEGTRSNLLVVDSNGLPCFPAPALGAVAGIGLEVSRVCAPGLTPMKLTREDLSNAREIVAVNAVRGARPCIALDGRPIGTGSPGPFAEELAAAMADA